LDDHDGDLFCLLINYYYRVFFLSKKNIIQLSVSNALIMWMFR
jgi:hypothetical protein